MRRINITTSDQKDIPDRECMQNIPLNLFEYNNQIKLINIYIWIMVQI